jgi:hypothetical protein
MQKNTANKWIVFAFNKITGDAVTGDAANITANLRLDGGAANPVDDTNPTELEGGYYAFDLTQAETNGDLIVICPSSVTANIAVIGVPGAVWTITAAAGAGAITWPYTLTDSDTGAPIDGAEVWVTTDLAGANIIASGVTDAYGVVTFTLDAGVVYVWRKKAGYNFVNPDTEVVA